MGLFEYLKKLPSLDSIAFRAVMRTSSSITRGARYRGVCKNGAKYQVGKAQADVHHGGRAAEDVHRRHQRPGASWALLRPCSAAVKRNQGGRGS